MLKTSWQRCRVHFIRNALAHASECQRQVVLAIIISIFVRDTAEAGSLQSRSVADQLRPKFPNLATMMDEAKQEVLTFITFQKRNGRRSTVPTRLSGSMPRSNEGQTSSIFSQTMALSSTWSAPLCLSKTTSGLYSDVTCSLKDCST